MIKQSLSLKELKESLPDFLQEEGVLNDLIDQESIVEIPFGMSTENNFYDGVFLVYLKDGLVKIPYQWIDYEDGEVFRIFYKRNIVSVNEKTLSYLDEAEIFLEEKLKAIRFTKEKQRLRKLTSGNGEEK